MITESGRVVAVNDEAAGRVWVETIQQSACESCSARAGCGQRVLASLSGGRANRILVTNSQGAAVGDQVRVAIADSALLQASLLVYALPLAFMVAGAIGGHQIQPEADTMAVVGAGSGLGLGFWLANRAQACLKGSFVPHLLPDENEAVAELLE